LITMMNLQIPGNFLSTWITISYSDSGICGWYYVIRTNISTIKKNIEALSDASKEVKLEVNTQKIKYMFMPHHHNARQNHNIKTHNQFFKYVTNFKYLGMTVTNQNCIREKIKNRLNLGNACFHSVQNLLS
jgi:hypothetical protein